MIPFIIHQTWKSRQFPADSESGPNQISKLEQYRRSWKQFNPNIDYRFYDDADCLAFVRSEFPALADLYERLPLPILRADLFRYLVVYRCGGLYADVDMECVKPLDRFLAESGAVYSIEIHFTRALQRRLGFRHPYQIANSIFASEAGHPFLGAIIDRAVSLLNSHPMISPDMVVGITGPQMVTRTFYEKTWADIHILKQVYWQPHHLYRHVFPLNANIFAIHHFLGSWKNAATSQSSATRETAHSAAQRWMEWTFFPNPLPIGMYHKFENDQ